MKQSKANCTEVEGLLPLYVGGDLDREDASSVGRHIERCAACAGQLERAEIARRELRRGLAELVDGREPQLWPAIREQLAREGLFREAGDLTPVPALAERRLLVPGGDRERRPYNTKILRQAGALAASLALIFLVGRNLDFGAGNTPDTLGGSPDSSGLARELAAPATSNPGDFGTALTGDLFAEARQPSGSTGLRPVSLGEKPLFDQARENFLRDQGSRPAGLFVPVLPAPSASEGDLASGFSLQ